MLVAVTITGCTKSSNEGSSRIKFIEAVNTACQTFKADMGALTKTAESENTDMTEFSKKSGELSVAFRKTLTELKGPEELMKTVTTFFSAQDANFKELQAGKLDGAGYRSKTNRATATFAENFIDCGAPSSEISSQETVG
jgi:hypothetical protein